MDKVMGQLYYQDEAVTIYHGDCRDMLSQVSDVDLVLTDPPYNISSDNEIIRRCGKFGIAQPIKLNFGDWDFGAIVPIDYIDELVRLLTRVGVLCLFYDKLYLGMIGFYLQQRYGFQVRHIGSWVKSNPAPQARKVKWQNGLECFLIATANTGASHHFNYKLGQSPDYFITSVNFKHLHPTQKPEEVIDWIISYWSFPGDLILDPFLGSGTTAWCAKKLGRKCVGYEIEEKYCEIAANRCRQIVMDLNT